MSRNIPAVNWLLTTARLASPAVVLSIVTLTDLFKIIILSRILTCFLFQVIKWSSVDLLEPVPVTGKEEIWEMTVKQDWYPGKQFQYWNTY